MLCFSVPCSSCLMSGWHRQNKSGLGQPDISYAGGINETQFNQFTEAASSSSYKLHSVQILIFLQLSLDELLLCFFFFFLSFLSFSLSGAALLGLPTAAGNAGEKVMLNSPRQIKIAEEQDHGPSVSSTCHMKLWATVSIKQKYLPQPHCPPLSVFPVLSSRQRRNWARRRQQQQEL